MTPMERAELHVQSIQESMARIADANARTIATFRSLVDSPSEPEAETEHEHDPDVFDPDFDDDPAWAERAR